MLQWAGPLWVRVRFPHIALLQKIENKNYYWQKNLKLYSPKLTYNSLL
jgi:hypothetical protein